MGNGDKNVEVERDSDTSELNSPASEGNPHHQHTFGEGNGEPEKSGPSPDDSVVTENKLEEKEVTAEASRSEEAGQQDVEVKIEEGTKSDQDVKNLEVSIEHVDSDKVSRDDSSSTSSSSDDESSAVEKKDEELQKTAASVTPKNQEDTVDFSTEEVTPTTETNAVISTSEEVIPTEVSNDTVKDDVLLDSDTPVASMSQVMEGQLQATQVGDSEVIDIFESGLKASELKSLPKSYPANDVPVLSDSRKNEEVLSTSDTNAEVVVSSVNEDKSLTSSGAVETTVKQNAPGTETSVDANNTKDTKFSDSTEKQPLLASAPRVSQRTSFLSCCGLFDAFTSSDR
ncbi:hypothetical protein LINPERHAP1_LOCUS38482 [Linum perenne]